MSVRDLLSAGISKLKAHGDEIAITGNDVPSSWLWQHRREA